MEYYLSDIVEGDQIYIFRGLSHPMVISYYGVSYHSFDETKEQMVFFQDLERNRTGKWWAIRSNLNHSFVGAIGFNDYQTNHEKIEVGFWLLPEYWGKRIIPRVLPIAEKEIRNLYQIHRIEAVVETENLASIRTLDKCGYILEGTLRDAERKNDRFISLSVFGKLF